MCHCLLALKSLHNTRRLESGIVKTRSNTLIAVCFCHINNSFINRSYHGNVRHLEYIYREPCDMKVFPFDGSISIFAGVSPASLISMN